MHVRVESPYLPIQTKVSGVSFTGEAQTKLDELIELAVERPPRLTNEISKVGRGKYCFIAFGGEKNLPIAMSICYIIPTANPDSGVQDPKPLDWGLITELVVDPAYHRKGVATRLVNEMIMRLGDEDVLLASGNTDGALAFLRVAIDSRRKDCQMVFGKNRFELVRGNHGERIYEYAF